jgi:hypothetical protein
VKDIWVTEDAVLVHGKCTKQLALIVEKSVKYHSNQQREGQSTVKRVGKNIDPQEESLGDISKKSNVLKVT